MKKTLLTMAIAATATLGAKAQTYYFSQSAGTYSPIVSTTTVNTGTWDDEEYTMPIGFSFTYAGSTYTETTLNANGFLSFDNSAVIRWFVAFGADLEDRGSTTSLSPITTSLEGSVGSRIRKFQWNNAGLYYGASSDFVNFQIWLHEGTNTITVHYGPNTIVNLSNAFEGETGPAAGLVTAVVNSTYTGRMLTGPAASPVLTPLTQAPDVLYLTGVPTNGTSYTFSLTPTSAADDVFASQLSLYPNPAADVVFVESAQLTNEPVVIRLFDYMGRQVLQQQAATESRFMVPMHTLPAGTYLLEVQQNGLRATRQVVKQ